MLSLIMDWSDWTRVSCLLSALHWDILLVGHFAQSGFYCRIVFWFFITNCLTSLWENSALLHTAILKLQILFIRSYSLSIATQSIPYCQSHGVRFSPDMGMLPRNYLGSRSLGAKSGSRFYRRGYSGWFEVDLLAFFADRCFSLRPATLSCWS